jgi:hypothetical protein
MGANDERTEFPVDPATPSVSAFTLNTKAMLPARFAEQLGARVNYISDTQPVTITYGDIVLTIEFGNSIMKKTVAGVAQPDITLEVAPTMVDGKTYAPIRAIAENIGFAVNYNANTFSAVVTNAPLTDAQYATWHKWAEDNMQTVIEPVRGVAVTPTTHTIAVGSYVQIDGSKIVLTPRTAGATVGCDLVVFSSSNPAVAEVTSRGRINAKSAGTAVITVTAHNGQYKAEITVTVK